MILLASKAEGLACSAGWKYSSFENALKSRLGDRFDGMAMAGPVYSKLMSLSPVFWVLPSMAGDDCSRSAAQGRFDDDRSEE